MAMDLTKLQQLMQAAAGAQGSQGGYESQLERANVLRDTPELKPAGDTGFISPWAMLARQMKIGRGESQATAAQAGLAKTRQQIAQAQSGKDIYGLQREQEQQVYARDRDTKGDVLASEALKYEQGRDTKGDVLASEALKYERGQLDDHETVWATDTNKPFQVATSKDGKTYIDMATNEPVTRPFTTQNPHAKGGSRYKTVASGVSGIPHTPKTFDDAYGNVVRVSFDKAKKVWAPTEFAASGKPWSEEEAKRLGGLIAGQAGSEVTAKEQSKVAVEGQEAAFGKLKELQKLDNHLTDLMSAMDAGASTGPIAGRVPFSVTDASNMLDNVVDRMALTEIGNYSFGALSEAEGTWLRTSSFPKTLTEKEAKNWIRHRQQGVRNLMESTKYEQEMRSNGFVPDPNVIQQILHSDGYKFADPE